MMKTSSRVTSSFRVALVALGLTLASSAFATPVTFYYTNWTAADPANGTATGTITLPDSSTVTVDFKAVYANGTHGSFLSSYVSGNWSWASYPATYTGSDVDNYPSGDTSDMLRLQGGDNQIYKVHLSAPIKGPLMDIVSLGQPGVLTQYNFDSPFTILNQGPAQYGGTSTSLQKSGNNLLGTEGNGTIKFVGTYSDFSWTVPTPEYWHGFTFGIRTTEAIEPNNPTDVPEPSPAPLFGLGLAGIGLLLLKRRLDRGASGNRAQAG